MSIFEPKRNASINSLAPYVAERVAKLIEAMNARGYDAVIYEARRSPERQSWLYSIGRTRQKSRKCVTWTMYSKHLNGKAVDIISKSHGWNAPGDFWIALATEARKVGMHPILKEACHIQYGD